MAGFGNIDDTGILAGVGADAVIGRLVLVRFSGKFQLGFGRRVGLSFEQLGDAE